MISLWVMDQQEWINTVVRTFSAVTGDSASVVLRGKWGWWNHLRCLLLVQPHLLSPAALSCDLLLSAHRQLQFTVRTLYHIHTYSRRWLQLTSTYNEKTNKVLEDMFCISTYYPNRTKATSESLFKQLSSKCSGCAVTLNLNIFYVHLVWWRKLSKPSFDWMVNAADYSEIWPKNNRLIIYLKRHD